MTIHLRVGTYHRVSTLDQNPELARDELRAAVDRTPGAALVMSVEETGSGAKSDRPGLLEIMAAARAGKLDAVWVWKLDRFGRSVIDVVTNVRELKTRGVRWLATSQGIAIGPDSGAVGDLTLTVLAAAAEFERELNRERTALGMANARKKGTKSGRPIGVPPANVSPVACARARELHDLGRGWRGARRALIAERLLMPYGEGKRAGQYPSHTAVAAACKKAYPDLRPGKRGWPRGSR